MIIDLTGIAVSVVGGVFSILGIFLTNEITAHSKDKAAAIVLENAVQNSLGAIQQSAVNYVETQKPLVHIDGVPNNVAVGVQYVLNHAGAEADRFGLTPDLIADKIGAAIGSKTLDLAHAMAVQSGTMPMSTVPVKMPRHTIDPMPP